MTSTLLSLSRQLQQMQQRLSAAEAELAEQRAVLSLFRTGVEPSKAARKRPSVYPPPSTEGAFSTCFQVEQPMRHRHSY